MYLAALGIELPCAMDASRRAILDAEHRAFVNWETYFFADETSRAAFVSDPLRWCGLVTDPISRERFRPTADSPRLEHGGRPYFFTSAATRDQFAAMPEMYALPKPQMLPQAGAPDARETGAAEPARPDPPKP
jgi:YHS domain-containing protein